MNGAPPYAVVGKATIAVVGFKVKSSLALMLFAFQAR